MGMLLSEKGIGLTAERIYAVVEARGPEKNRSLSALKQKLASPLQDERFTA